jgi:hypothetical protein
MGVTAEQEIAPTGYHVERIGAGSTSVDLLIVEPFAGMMQ